MPDTIPDQPALAAPATPSVDLFFDQVVHAVRRQEARLSPPFSYDLSSTADFTGLPVRLLRRMCRDTELRAIKLFGRWLLHRDEFNRLLAPEVTLRSRAARQYILVRNLQQLGAMFRPHDASHFLHVLLHDLRRAVMFREDGAVYEDAEGMVWHRAEWRIREGIVDPDLMEDALRLLEIIVRQGMELFRGINWRRARLSSMIVEQTGVDLGPGRSSLLPIDAACDYPIDLSFAA